MTKIQLQLVTLCVLLVTFVQAQNTADPRALEQFIKGNAASEQGNPYQAIFFFEEAIRFDPVSPFLYVALAEQYLVLAQENSSSEALSRAESALAKALDLDETHESALQLKSRLLAAQGKTDAAEGLLTRLLTAHPENDEYRLELLALCLAGGSFDKVDSLYRIVQDNLSEPDLELTRRIVAIYLMTGQSKRSISYMQELAAADSLDAAVTYTLATLYLQTDDSVEATEYAHRAVELDSADSRYWYLLLVLEFDRGHYDEVLELASRAKAAAGEDAKSANLEGLSYLHLGDSTWARERFTRSLELDSTLYPAAGSLGLLYDAVDSLDQAVFYYEWAIRLSDSAAIYMNNLAYTFAVRGIENERAMVLVDAALAKEPENSSYLDTKGWIYYQIGEYREALNWIRRAMKYDDDSPPLLEHLGDVYLAMGKRSQARSHWKQALEADSTLSTVRAKLEE